MKVLVLGGTRFVGRHIVECLVHEGHKVVCFHRGKTTCDLPASVEERLGDRNSDLASVQGDVWDSVVDVACYEPEQVRKSLTLRSSRYVFVSTVNVYEDVTQAGTSEDAPTIQAFDSSDEALNYGGSKAACERLVMDAFGVEATILRPGMIVGKWDYTGRLSYWCDRVLRGGPFIVPAPPNRQVQFIDAADLARFAARALAHDLFGYFNIVGPRDATSMQDFIVACQSVAMERGAPECRPVWVDETFLLDHGVRPWIEMPLWLPEPRWRGVLQISNVKAVRAGLGHRAIADTVRSVLDCARSDDRQRESPAGLHSSRELELLEKLDAC